MKLANFDLYNAICRLDVDGVKCILDAGKCCINGDGSEIGLPVIECVRIRKRREPEDDDSKRCEILKLLVQNGADVNIQSFPQLMFLGNKETAAIIAAKNGHLKCLQFLVDSGADLSATSSKSKETVLMVAAREGQLHCLKYLTQCMPAFLLNPRNEAGRTALMLSAVCGKRDGFLCLQNLIESGADLEVKDGNGDTALMLALEVESNRHTDDSAILLLEKGALVNTTGRDQETPLTRACRNKPSEVVELMLIKGALVNAVSQQGYSLLSVSKPKHLPTLLRHGLDLTFCRRNHTSLHDSVSGGNAVALRRLVMNGFPPIDINVHDAYLRFTLNLHNGQTPMSPLAYALYFIRPGIAKYLITNRFLTRFDIAQLGWDKAIRQYLHNKGLQARRCLNILDFISTKPQSLRDLCFITVSSALSQDFSLGFHRTRSELETCWVCKPTFIERVNRLDTPFIFKRELLHQTASSAICCSSWNDITLGEENSFPPCQCGECDGILTV
ncbi:ankyrin repeat-containing protein [Elysia marginata]|uniref:Ankyrin repeat-containing protein n=1 Tax=Elysia marginata TaxID=1093978 RepID=A0AAV4HMR5_9GAST|nr:ankyrin repeat-containing protein [Elysia marginata]